MRSYHLLIDKSYLRPPSNDPKANDWERMSRVVRSWLVTSISWEVYFDVKMLTGNDPQYADDMWEGIKLATLNYNVYSECNVAERFKNLKPKSFKTLSAFLHAHSKGLKDMERAGFNPDMKYVTLSLLNDAAYFKNQTVNIIKRRLYEEKKQTEDYDKTMYFDIIREIFMS